jgi:hypothetical protein
MSDSTRNDRTGKRRRRGRGCMGFGLVPGHGLTAFPDGGDVAPFVVTCGREVVDTGWEFDDLVRRTTLRTRNQSERYDYCIWLDDERLLATVFSTGQLLVYQHVSGRTADLKGALQALRDGNVDEARRCLAMARATGHPTAQLRLLHMALDLAEQGKLHLVPSLLDGVHLI